jgi:hypothetical protein
MEQVILSIPETVAADIHNSGATPLARWLMVRWFCLDGHKCCLNNEQHYYEKESIQFISTADKTRSRKV